MKNLLEDLWYSYVIDKRKGASAEERKLVNSITEIDKTMRNALNDNCCRNMMIAFWL